jgi:glycosyltransferase involved in cell wall biosynthesis
LGETHPVILRQEGENYRDSLQKRAEELGVAHALMFVNRYLDLEEIVDYLKATDIYITPFINLDQITSGTLSYAVGAGRACISTTYLYAQEVLDKGRGTLVPPADGAAIADAAIDLLDNPKKRLDMAKKAYAYGRNMIWPSVALRHLDLFELVTNETSDAA